VIAHYEATPLFGAARLRSFSPPAQSCCANDKSGALQPVRVHHERRLLGTRSRRRGEVCRSRNFLDKAFEETEACRLNSASGLPEFRGIVTAHRGSAKHLCPPSRPQSPEQRQTVREVTLAGLKSGWARPITPVPANISPAPSTAAFRSAFGQVRVPFILARNPVESIPLVVLSRVTRLKYVLPDFECLT
jgi:hypothetical protein